MKSDTFFHYFTSLAFIGLMVYAIFNFAKNDIDISAPGTGLLVSIAYFLISLKKRKTK